MDVCVLHPSSLSPSLFCVFCETFFPSFSSFLPNPYPHPLSPSYPILYHLLHLHRIPRCFSLRGGLGKFVLVPHLIFNHLRSSDCAHGDTSPGVGYKLVGRRSQLRRRLSVTVARTSLARNSRRSGLFVTVTTIWCWSASAWTVGVVWSSRV